MAAMMLMLINFNKCTQPLNFFSNYYKTNKVIVSISTIDQKLQLIAPDPAF